MDDGDLEPLLRWWRAQDAAFADVGPYWWGAVVSDGRFPRIQEANYARVETRQRVRLAEIEEPLRSAMANTAGGRSHVVVFHPDDQTDLVVEASSRGERLAWDLVMVHDAIPPDPRVDVGEVEPSDPRFEPVFRTSMASFGVDDPDVVDQIVAVEREVFLPSGRRWFAVAEDDAIVALAGLSVLEGVGYVDHVMTLPHARRRGYATALVSGVVAEARAAGAERTYLLTEPDGAALRVYERIGFRAEAQIASWISTPT